MADIPERSLLVFLTGFCFRCGFAPARCGSMSGKAGFAPRAGAVLGSAYTRVEMISKTDKRLYRAYCLKESLRLLLKLKNPDEAEVELKHWLWRASHSRIPAVYELYKKIKRHMDHILNAIRLGMSNARIEATNNKIKLVIRKAYGFRNTQNLIDMVYLVCSDLRIPLHNRKPILGL